MPRILVTDGSVSPLLKTPTANLGRNGAPQDPEKRKKGGHGPTLEDEAVFLLPYSEQLRWHGSVVPTFDGGPHSPAAWWGDYLPVVRRWEDILGRAAPAPTELGPRGGLRLSPRWAEWLMGLPVGWVTDVPGMTHGAMLGRLGNGAMPQQALEAYRRLLDKA